jgi:DNA mismatch repair protein MutH
MENRTPYHSSGLPYDPKDSHSILAYAKQLENHSLSEILDIEHVAESQAEGKGRLGQLLEEHFFRYKPNSISEPDFKEAGVELKTTPMKKTTKGLVSKERLVLNIINYQEEHSKTFRTSSFWNKNALLLLMFYLYEQETLDIDYIFKIIRLWKFPEQDLKIIKDDWNKIVTKIREGQAHNISEGDTFYLGACTKGATKASTRSQPFSSAPAMQRAFSLKSSYLNYIIRDSLPDAAPAVKSEKEYGPKETFEELIIRRFRKYYGKSEAELVRLFKLGETSAKHKFYLIARAILEVGLNKKIEEFEKAGVEIKTIRIEKSGSIKESMSFAQIKYKEIVKEEWEDSYWYSTLTKRFFFIIFQKDEKSDLKLKKVMFWTMPTSDLEVAYDFWEDTKKKVKMGAYDQFIKISDDRLCHVRPKGMDSHDLMETPQGTMEKKKCYWLNADYIRRQSESR